MSYDAIFIAICNIFGIAGGKSVMITREFFSTTGNATLFALQVARKIAFCSMALVYLE